MLRSRLYIGMFPVAGLLILVCLYSIYNYKKVSVRMDVLQRDHYQAISEIDRLLLATSQMERSILLRKEGENELAERTFQRSVQELDRWLQRSEERVFDERKKVISQYVRNLRSLGNAVFDGGRLPSRNVLSSLIESIEENALYSISEHNDVIFENNTAFQSDARTHYYVVVSAIVASVFLMGYVAYSMSQRILAPIDALTESASKLGGDNWDLDFQPSSKDEIARLETAFIEMAERIKEYRRATNKQLLITRRRMEECFNNLPNPVLFLNSKRELAYKNPAADDLLAQASWGDVVKPQIRTRIEKVFGTGEEVVETDYDEAVSVTLDGESTHFLPIFVRVDSDEVDEIECGVVLQDVTRLRLSDELKSDLVATVSHEIKTPVTSAGMAIHLLLEKGLGELNEDQEDLLNTANSDLSRLRRLLDHLLEIARLESKAPRLQATNVAPATIVASVVDAYRLSAQGKEMDLSVNLQEKLPRVSADVKALEVALSNFLSNAIKYSPMGSEVEVYARQSGERIRFGVLDEGPGIPEDERERIFDKFYRTSPSSKVEGVGLGLSIVKDIALAHGGGAGCMARAPQGCDFYIEIDALAGEAG